MSKPLRLEALFTSAHSFGIETATPVQRAACRAADGFDIGDELWDVAEVRAACGGTRPRLSKMPFEFILLGGTRGGKSTMVAAAAVRSSQNCDVSKLKPGDLPRVPVLSIDKDTATATFNHIAQNVSQRPALKKLLLGEPTADTVWLRHPTGLPIEIKVVALAKYASTLTARWFASAIFDEAPRMVDENGGVRNLTEARASVRSRILPGGQVFEIGSPNAPFGPIYELFKKHFGAPTARLVVMKAQGAWLNPGVWTPELLAELKDSEDAVDRRAYKTDGMAEFADLEEAMFSSLEVEQSMRPDGQEILEPREGLEYVGSIDPATRGNGWTFTLGTCDGLGGPGGALPSYAVAYHREWRGSKMAPLKADHVFEQIAEVCQRYGVTSLYTDQYSVDALAVVAAQYGITLICEQLTTTEFTERVETLRQCVSQRRMSLPNDKTMRYDLLQVRRRATPTGYRAALATTPDGRHCDYVPVLALLMGHMPDPPVQLTRVREHRLQRLLDEVDAKKGGEFWEGVGKRLTG